MGQSPWDMDLHGKEGRESQTLGLEWADGSTGELYE